jgi:dTDP-glucose 4,6-dehydratase
MSKSILITGGAGFIGSCFAIDMIKRGHKVVVIDALTYAGNLQNLEEIERHQNYTFVKGNINDTILVSTLLNDHNIDWLVNFAAESHVDNSIASPNIFIETNVNGTLSLLNASLAYYKQLSNKENFRFLHVSTDEVYGSLGPTGYFSETSTYQPNSPYSASKAGADHLVRAWHETFGLPTITTNCSNNYGPRQHPEKLIPKIITNAINNKPLPVYGDGQNIRDWIYVDIHCHGIYLALTKGKAGDCYCLGEDGEMTNLEITHKICDILDNLKPRKEGKYSDLITFVKDRLGHDRRYAIDSSKAKKELGFAKVDSFDNNLLKTIKWYLNRL